MTRRKTVKIDDLLEAANRILAKSVNELTRERAGTAMLLEAVLAEHDAYRGYLEIDETETDGIRDDTRRVYL